MHGNIMEESSIVQAGRFFDWRLPRMRHCSAMPELGFFDNLNPVRVAERVKALREALGMDKAEFADLVGIDRSSFTKIEKGEKPLKAEMGFAISERFGVSMDYLYRGQLRDLPESLAPIIRKILAQRQV